MNDSDFIALADQVLDSIERQADDWAASMAIDIETRRQGNVLTLVFENGTQVVINSQTAMQEIWVAARSGGFHYRYTDHQWNDTRSGPPLHEALSHICTQAARVPVTVRL